MCILKMESDTRSFREYSSRTAMPVYSITELGDVRRPSTGEVYGCHRISLDVSTKEWDDIQGQIQDAITFLAKWEVELRELIASHHVRTACLDFPLYSRLDGNIVNQNDHLPKALIELAGRIGLGIEMAVYARDAFRKEEES